MSIETFIFSLVLLLYYLPWTHSEHWSSVFIVDFEQVFAIFVHILRIRQVGGPSNNRYTRANEKDIRATPWSSLLEPSTGWLQGRLSLSSFRGQLNEYQELLGTKLCLRSDSEGLKQLNPFFICSQVFTKYQLLKISQNGDASNSFIGCLIYVFYLFIYLLNYSVRNLENISRRPLLSRCLFC